MIKRSAGFTLIELIVTMAIGSLLVVAAVGMYLTVLGQSPVVKTRNTLSTNLQNALNRINDDVRRSSNVTPYNMVPDPNAPTTKTGYENVPGPDIDTNDQYYWRMSENRLILNQTPLNSTSGDPIYSDAAYAAGQKNAIVYYVRNNALYRRVIAAPVANNAASTITCTPRAAEGGCITSDVKLVDNLKASLGAAAFKVTYFDRNGNPIPYTSKDSAGIDVPDYTGFPLTRAIGVTLQLESGQIAGTQTVAVTNSMRMQFRSQLNIAPTTVVEPYVPPTNGVGDPGLMVGPGGLSITGAIIQGGDAYVKGKVYVGFNSRIGGAPFLTFFGGGTPANLNVANIGCGSGNSYPTPCGSSSPPITLYNSFATINGQICAKDQPIPTAGINPYASGLGLLADCTPPDVDMPSFNKAGFVNQMTSTSLGTLGSCNGGNLTTTANRTYTGNVSWSFFCKVSISGSMYITGGLSTSTADIRVAESAGKVRPIIVVNGRIDLNGKIYPNSYGTTPYFISFFSSDSACSNSNTCTSISPAKLKETLDTYTGQPFTFGNAPVSLINLTATGSSFYSYYGETYLDFFTKVGAVGGQRVKVNNADISMDAKL